ncbi:hypothetical protein [Clostridium grantii]|uniref:Uncharacterized protein n=1 Tax=Clostridium grantii DSM 8605 TaxID=1121316 RepID=A0A1M5Y3E3_9CLOT|nr:hypothetical protein [Clostridium grantii]SHI06023.1 hypothetical protein SAMN02745207_04129 [Clostridium grantii DSM 8605]
MYDFSVETYNNPNEYFKNIEYKANELHVMSTSSYSMHLKLLLGNGKAKNKVWTYNDFRKSLNPELHMSLTEIKMKIALRKIIEETVEDKILCSLLINDIEEVFSSCNYLMEIEMNKLKIEELMPKEEKAFRKVYNLFSNLEFIKDLRKDYKEIDYKKVIDNLNKWFLQMYTM